MKVRNIVFASSYREEFQRITEIGKEVRFIAEPDVTEEDLEWADAYAGFRPAPTFHLRNIRWIHSTGAGVDRFIGHVKEKPDVLLTRTIGSFGRKISEYCLSYIFRELQQHEKYEAAQQKREWAQELISMSLSGVTVVVFGTGEIGSVVAQSLSWFGARVVGVSRMGTEKEGFCRVVPLDDALDAVSGADWIISTLPLTSDTKHLFTEPLFRAMNGARFINVGRGATVAESDLLQALDRGDIRSAVLDVFAEEPLPALSPLWTHDKVRITPHISAVTEPNEAVEGFLDTLQRIERGLPLLNLADPTRGY